jgi:hypothetical protein
MHLEEKIEKSGAVPLHEAVLCVDCECITGGRIDVCPVCGSRSLMNIGQILGGQPLSSETVPVKDIVRFDLTLTIELKQMTPRDVNTAIERITRMIEPRLGQRGACFHIRVDPLDEPRIRETKAA